MDISFSARSTCKLIIPMAPSLVAETSTVPLVTAVINPSPLTVAMAGLLET